jgi:hypothetical protein
MRLRALVAVGVVMMGMMAAPARALETDQFTVPDRPLPDLGPALDLKIDLVLRELANDANEHLAKGGKEAERYRSNDFFADRLSAMFSGGIPECTIESWVRNVDVGDRNARFDVGIMQSVYGRALIGRPLTLFTLSPTINLYGHYLGTDKVGHFFQQGSEYYDTFRAARRAGKSEHDSVRAAVLEGVSQEDGIYGMFIVDVYSNADLASNLAGLTFYRNLTEAVRLPDGVVLPPMLVLRHGRWELNAYAGDAHIRPFVSDHWDESMNPCRYAPLLRNIVRDNVERIGARWVAFHHATRDGEVRRLDAMRKWHGIAYGHSGYGDVITIVNRYFDAHADTAVASKR